MSCLFSFKAACGGFAAGVFAKNTEAFTDDYAGFKFSSYGWAFYLFVAGVAIMGIVSFTACFAAPNNPMHGMILSSASPSVVVQTSNMMSSNPYFKMQENNSIVAMPASNGY
jgi:hypothetical protein